MTLLDLFRPKWKHSGHRIRNRGKQADRPGAARRDRQERCESAPGRVGPSGGAGAGKPTRLTRLSDLEIKPGEALLDHWRIISELGRGGFGAVFLAEDLLLERQPPAIKVLDPQMAAKQELLARFRREVTLMRELAHERIVRVLTAVRITYEPILVRCWPHRFPFLIIPLLFLPYSPARRPHRPSVPRDR